MSTPFILHNVSSQLPIVTASEIVAVNLTITQGVSINDGGFITTTVVGNAPSLAGAALGATIPFINLRGSGFHHEGEYLRIPANATITRCTLSNNGVEILSPSTPIFQIYTSDSLGIPPTKDSIILYDSVGSTSINNSSVLIVASLQNSPGFPAEVGSGGAPPKPLLTLKGDSYVLVQSTSSLTSGDLRISIQYQLPVVKG